MKNVSTTNAPAAIGPYSQGYVVGNLVFASGQIPVDPATGEVAGPDIAAQAEQSCKNVKAVIEAGGSDISKVFKTTCFLADMADYAQLNQAWDEWVDSQNPPSRATVEAKLADPDWKVEIVIIAAV